MLCRAVNVRCGLARWCLWRQDALGLLSCARYWSRTWLSPGIPGGCGYGTHTQLHNSWHSPTKKWAHFPILLNKTLQSCKSC